MEVVVTANVLVLVSDVLVIPDVVLPIASMPAPEMLTSLTNVCDVARGNP